MSRAAAGSREKAGNQLRQTARRVWLPTFLTAVGCAALPGRAMAQPAPATAEDAAPIALLEADLALLPQASLRTGNEFTDGEHSYTGPLVRDVLRVVGLAEAGTVRFTAANDYTVEIPVADFDRYDAILARRLDGRPMSLRDKGPLWLMYPVSAHPELRDPIYVSRLIWQVVAVEAVR